MPFLSLFLFLFFIVSIQGRFDANTNTGGSIPKNSDPIPKYPDEYYNYISLDDGHESTFFYKLSTILPEAKRPQQPLVMWLQGGPGASSFFGDYLEIGPLRFTVKNSSSHGVLEPNPYTWAKHATLLFIDSPIGTGFSFTKSPEGFSTSDDSIATNLVVFMQKFLAKHPEYVQNKFWIFSESYGGKVVVFFGNKLAKAIIAKKFPKGFSLGGVGVGDGWTHPINCMESYSSTLFAIGNSNEKQSKGLDKFAVEAAARLARGDGAGATLQWSLQQQYLSIAANRINMYNSLVYFSYLPDEELDNWLLNTFPYRKEVTKYVTIKSPFGAQSNEVFERMKNAFMQDGVKEAESLLSMGITVAVYVGEVDLIVNPICTRKWVNNMNNWTDIDGFRNAKITPYYHSKSIFGGHQVLATQQAHKNLELWTIMTAGHMVPSDNPIGSEIMFAKLIKSDIPVKAVQDDEPFRVAQEIAVRREIQRKRDNLKGKPKKTIFLP